MAISNTISFCIGGIDYLDLEAGDQYRVMGTEFPYHLNEKAIAPSGKVLAVQFTYGAFELKVSPKIRVSDMTFSDVIIILFNFIHVAL